MFVRGGICSVLRATHGVGWGILPNPHEEKKVEQIERVEEHTIYVNYDKGVEQPEFWKKCESCNELFGPFYRLAEIQGVKLCNKCMAR